MVTVSGASAHDGDIQNPHDNDSYTAPYRTSDGYVTARLDPIPMDCPAFASSCRLQVRLANKGTNWWSTWYEHPVQTYFGATSGYTYATKRKACGTHYWKLQHRIVYTAAVTTTVKEAGAWEYGNKGEGYVGTTYRKLWEVAVRLGQSLGFSASRERTVTVTAGETRYTEWEDVDHSSSTINTVC